MKQFLISLAEGLWDWLKSLLKIPKVRTETWPSSFAAYLLVPLVISVTAYSVWRFGDDPSKVIYKYGICYFMHEQCYPSGTGEGEKSEKSKNAEESEKAEKAEKSEAIAYASIFEQVTTASIYATKTSEMYNQLLAVERGRAVLETSPETQELTRELAARKLREFQLAKEDLARALQTAYTRRLIHTAEFDAAATSYETQLKNDHRRFHQEQFTRALQVITKAPLGANAEFFQQVAENFTLL